MPSPDYKNGSIVNLMSSIIGSFDVDSPYDGLSGFDNLTDTKDIILVVLDGIGYKYLREKGKDTFLYEHLERKITSVFPSSTASAVPTFMTGLPPQQHGVTGWYTYLRELGVVSTILPFRPRYGGQTFPTSEVDIDSILSDVSLFNDIEEDKYYVTKNKIKDSAFNRFYTSNIDVFGYDKTKGFFDRIKSTMNKEDDRKFIFGYWNNFDGAAHKNGVNSLDASIEFLNIDTKLREFVESIKDTDSVLFLTADHGFIDSSEEKTVRLEDHQEFADCLTLPLCGDYRSLFCYVHPDKEEKFIDYWEDELSDYCDLYRSVDLVEEGYFGLFEPNPKFLERIGDYVLIMKDDYIMFDTLPNEDDHFIIGNHGGVSSREMYVPLSVVQL